MKLLLDTHILLWAIADSPQLPAQARLLIENPDNEIYFSTASPWEVQIKHQAHPDKLTFDAQTIIDLCRASGFKHLPIKLDHTVRLGSLQYASGFPPHKDPFDRILVCQAACEGMLFVTADGRIANYTEPCILKV